jgi:hypothetical protein
MREGIGNMIRDLAGGLLLGLAVGGIATLCGGKLATVVTLGSVSAGVWVAVCAMVFSD